MELRFEYHEPAWQPVIGSGVSLSQHDPFLVSLDISENQIKHENTVIVFICSIILVKQARQQEEAVYTRLLEFSVSHTLNSPTSELSCIRLIIMRICSVSGGAIHLCLSHTVQHGCSWQLQHNYPHTDWYLHWNSHSGIMKMNDGLCGVLQSLHATLTTIGRVFATSTAPLPFHAHVPLDTAWQLRYL